MILTSAMMIVNNHHYGYHMILLKLIGDHHLISMLQVHIQVITDQMYCHNLNTGIRIVKLKNQRIYFGLDQITMLDLVMDI